MGPLPIVVTYRTGFGREKPSNVKKKNKKERFKSAGFGVLIQCATRHRKTGTGGEICRAPETTDSSRGHQGGGGRSGGV